MFPLKTRFLIVDDFPTMRKMIKKVLTDIGFKDITEATDGRDALKKINDSQAKNESFDFIISDWNMPNMLGIDLLKHCKKEEILKNIPFILITAESDQKNILEAIQLGASEFIVKPFNANTLKDKLEKVFLKSKQVANKSD